MVKKHGYSYLIPSDEKELPAITSFKKWEQAFRVFSSIYVMTHPDGANQLYQYMDTIAIASTSFVWENVYNDDQLFRQLMTYFPNSK